MSLKGNLQSVDLANVLQMLSINQKEGALILFDGDTRKSIYFARGGVSMLSRGRKGMDSLGRILMRYGRITKEQLAQALEAQKSGGGRLGEVLGAMGAATSEDVENAVRTQIEEEIYNLFIWKEASFEFIEGPPPVLDNVPAQVTFNVNSLIMEAQRRADEWNYIRGLVPTLDEVYKPSETMDQASVTDEVFHLPFAPRLLEVLHEGRLNVSEAIESSCASKFEACKIIALLLEQGAVEPVSIADLQRLAQESTARNDHPQAAKFLSRIVELGGATPPVNMQLGYALEALDEPERASLHLKAAGESYIEAMEPAHAYEAFSRVVKSLPTDLVAVTQMVEIACNNPEILAAHSHDVIEAGRTLARCQKEQGRLPAALQILHRLAQSTPQDLPLRGLLVLSYQESGMNNEAMAELEAMAEVCTKQGNYDEAIRCLRKVTAIDRNRAGVVKKIEGLSRLRDRGKRLALRLIAAGAVLLSLGAAAWAFLWFQETKKRHKVEIEKVISDGLDPLKNSFDAAGKRFDAAASSLRIITEEVAVESVVKDVASLGAAAKEMEKARAEVEARARGILAGHEDGCAPTENLVEKRTASMRRVLLANETERDNLLSRIVERAQDSFRDARRAAETRPIGSIPRVRRAVGLIEAAERPKALLIAVGNREENAREILEQLEKYRGFLDDLQVRFESLWKDGKREAARNLLTDYLSDFPSVIEFRELLRFRVRVTTVPAGASIRVLSPGGGEGEEEKGLPSPRELEYTAAGGLRLEVAADGFQTRDVAIAPLPEGGQQGRLRELIPHDLPVVLPKVPKWSLSIETGSLEAAPASSPEGKAVVVADRAGWLHLITTEDGREVQRYDTLSLSGFASSPRVTEDSVYAASLDGVVVGLDLLGLTERWRIPPDKGPGSVASRPLLFGDLVIVSGVSGKVIAYRAKDGVQVWQVLLPSGSRRDPILVGDRIVLLSEDGQGRVIERDGKGVQTFLPSASPRPSHPLPVVGPIAAGGKILLGLEGQGQEMALVELPFPGGSGVHIGHRWGISFEGAEPSGAAVDGSDILLVFSNGMARRASVAQGAQPGTLPFRLLPPGEVPLGSPMLRDGVYLQTTRKSLMAFRLKGAEVEEIWKWSDSEGVDIGTPPVIAGRFVVLCTRDGKVHGLLRD